jgi:hypothetical protein
VVGVTGQTESKSIIMRMEGLPGILDGCLLFAVLVDWRWLDS